MIIHKSVSEINTEQWQELVDRSSTASFFQTRECYDFYASLSFLTPFVFGVSEDDKLMGIICGYIIANGNIVKQYFSRRAIVPGGLLLDTRIPMDALQQLLECAAHELRRKAIYVEIRNYNDYSYFRSVFEAVRFTYQPHLNFHVATHNFETALKQMNTTKRRDIKLSKKEGVECSETKEPGDIKIYYKILYNLYKTKIKVPLFPYEFFEKLVLVHKGKLFVVKYQGEIIGGSICVCLSDRILYEWFVCGLDGQRKNVFPSTLATWAAIEYAANNSFNYFDMMGAGKPNEGYGVREFKSRFGGMLVEHGRFLFIQNKILFKLGKFIVNYTKKIK